MKKRCLSLLMVLALCLGLIAPAFAVPEYFYDFSIPVEGGNIYFRNRYGPLEVVGADPELTELVIPDNVDGVPVTQIAYQAFAGYRDLTRVTIPASVTVIKDGAFHGCENLARVDLPDSLTTIEGSAFGSCTSLTELTVPNSVTTLGKYAFSGCIKLNQVNIPSGVTALEEGLFNECASLSQIAIPDRVTKIGAMAFEGCSSLTNISIPDSVTELGDRAFSRCINLTGPVKIPDGVTELRQTFSGCHKLTGVILPDSITSIQTAAFYECASLTEIAIPNSVTEIGYTAFQGCTRLTQAKLPDGVTKIDANAFSDCPNLVSVTIPASVTELGAKLFVLRTQTGEDQWGWATWEEKPNDKLIVYGEADSYAETWCAENGVHFVAGKAPAFVDVPDWCVSEVEWAVEQGIAKGTGGGKFSPGNRCTVRDILTFLYRADGSPEVSGDNPFTDVAADTYYTAPAIWASEKGLASGDTLNGKDGCTRAMVAVYLWKLAGSPDADYDGSFTDVTPDADYAQAVAWAVEHNITKGVGDGLFNPDGVCKRGEIAAFLYRFYTKAEEQHGPTDDVLAD